MLLGVLITSTSDEFTLSLLEGNFLEHGVVKISVDGVVSASSSVPTMPSKVLSSTSSNPRAVQSFALRFSTYCAGDNVFVFSSNFFDDLLFFREGGLALVAMTLGFFAFFGLAPDAAPPDAAPAFVDVLVPTIATIDVKTIDGFY